MIKIKSKKSYIKLLLATAFVTVLVPSAFPKESSAASNGLIFPVLGEVSYTNDFEAARGNGQHNATDLIAAKGAPVVAAVSGKIIDVQYPEPYWGYSITIESNSGWQYRYIHMNNDTPGTDDGNGGPQNAYAVGMKIGDRVNKGQLIGWNGDSGNAEETVSHIHFERYKPDGTVVNPYYALRNATVLEEPRPAPRQSDEILPNLQGQEGVNVDVGNFAGDDNLEVVTGLQAGSTPTVSVYNRLNKRMYTFDAYRSNFTGGVDVATGDVDGDGYDEIITGTGGGGGPLIKVFEANGTFVKNIWPFPFEMNTGIFVSSGDIDNDGVDEIIVGSGPGFSPQVRAFELNGRLITSFISGNPNFLGGIDVAAGDFAGDEAEEIVTSYRTGGGPYIKTYYSDGTPIKTFTPYSTRNFSGIRVSAGNLYGSTDKDEIAVVLMEESAPLAKFYTGNGEQLASIYFWESWWKGNYDIAIGTNAAKGSTGINRRSSVRDI